MGTPKFESGPRIPWFDKEIFDEYMKAGDESRLAYESFLDTEKQVRETRDVLPRDILDSLRGEASTINGRIAELTVSGVVESPELDQLRESDADNIRKTREVYRGLAAVLDERAAKLAEFKAKHVVFMEVADRMLQRTEKSE